LTQGGGGKKIEPHPLPIILGNQRAEAKVEANVLFDQGAQRTWMTKALEKRLDLHPTTRE
jgi:hypothetical protein